jgi:hypothetical protein
MKTLYRIVTMTFASAILMSVAGPASAQIAPQTCDTAVWRTMEDRARLETEREIMQNQNLIFKADSVLTYTCFDSLAAHAVQTVGPLFTHTNYWGTQIIPPTGRNGVPGLGGAVQNAAIAAMQTYMTGNFNGPPPPSSGDPLNNTPLGGRGSQLGLAAPTVRAVTPQGASYSCSQMSTVWNTAKCMNFMHTDQFARNDGFYPFDNLQGFGGSPTIEGYASKNDTRRFPYSCGSSSQPVPGGWSTFTNGSRNSSNGTTFDLRYQFGTPTGRAFQDVRTLVGGGTSTSCAEPVYTGVTVILTPGTSSQRPYRDGVCVTPGCTFRRNGSGGACLSGGSAPSCPGGGPC